MATLPRIITVDPTGSIKAQISAATDLMDRFVTQIDVPSANYALEELRRGGIDTVIAAWEPGDGMQGWELAAKLKQIDEKVSVILLGDYQDTAMDEDMLAQSPFVYLKRPFDIPQLIRVLQAALNGEDMRSALRQPMAAAAVVVESLGPVPSLDKDRAYTIIQGVVRDLTPIATMLVTRDGEVLVGHGPSSEQLNYDEVSMIVRQAVISNLHLRDKIGSNAQAFIFYDGDEYDIFVLSVGLHHFLTIVLPGKEGSRQLGAVSRFGRRHAEDLIGLLGANAWIMQRPIPVEEPKPEVVRKSQTRRATQEIEVMPELARASIGGTTEEAEPEPESVMPQLEAIADDEFDPDALFAGDFDEGQADDLFSLDALEDLAQDEGKKGTLDWDKAKELGILGD